MKVKQFTFYIDDWRGSYKVADLNAQERGAYFELMIWCYIHNNKAPYNRAKFARVLNEDGRKMDRIMDSLMDVSLAEKWTENGQEFIKIPSIEKRLKLHRGASKGGKVKAARRASPNGGENPTLNTQYLKDLLINNKSLMESFLKSLENFPKELRPKTEKQKLNWLDTYEKLNRIDKFDYAEIERIITAARKDEFWCQNFLSMLKLRKNNKDGVKYFIAFQQKFTKKNKLQTDSKGLVKAPQAR